MVKEHFIGEAKTPLLFENYPHSCEEFANFPDYETYEPEVVSVIEHFVREGDCVVDAGASVGFHTCLMSKLVKESGIVLAFEPHLESYKLLMNHVHVANKLNNVACLRMALWKEDVPELELYSVDHLGYSSFHKYKHAAYSEKMEGRMLDTLLLNDHPRLIKIDCEGTEAEVLLGAQKILERGVDAVILELNFVLNENVGRSDKPMRDYMASIGYDCFAITMSDPEKKRLLPPVLLPRGSHLRIEHGTYINVLFSTPEKVRERWKTYDT